MKPPPFVYHRPDTLDEALDLLGEHGDEAKVLAGGQSLLPLLSLRLAHPAHLVDINRIDGQLSQVAQPDGGSGLSIGALVRQRAAEASPVVRAGGAVLGRARAALGDAPMTQRRTAGGGRTPARPATPLPGARAAAGHAQAASSGGRGKTRQQR